VTHDQQFYIDGAWVDPQSSRTLDVVNPSTEEAFARISLGSTSDVDRAVDAARRAADTVKRVCQELGGKSPNILLPDADLDEAVTKGVKACFANSGQSCDAPTLMYVPRDQHDKAAAIAKAAAERLIVGPADQPGVNLGPVVGKAQFDKIQSLIESGLADGATLVTGGLGRPSGLNRGYFARPTVFANVNAGMRIAREEIFGPVLSITPYDDVDEAVERANDTAYGLASYVQSRDLSKARAIARRMRTGNVHINYPAWDISVPFGGYKHSGNGRAPPLEQRAHNIRRMSDQSPPNLRAFSRPQR